jgi:hypothetical protein
VELTQGAGKDFEAAIAAEQSKLQGETLWYRMVVGGDRPRYVRLRPRASLAAILDERADQAFPDKVYGLISKMTVETLNLRPNMLVNVTPEPPRQWWSPEPMMPESDVRQIRGAGLSEEQAYLTLQRQSHQKRKPMKIIAEAIVLSDVVRGSPQVRSA